jgi:hypothetical protein
MADLVACLHKGKVEVLRGGQAAQRLQSPYQERQARLHLGHAGPQIVSLTRGRTSAELCYAIRSLEASSVFAQVPGSGNEQLLFHADGSRLSELDFSLADEALACTVAGERGTSAIGVLRDDGKGLRTVTEGDVLDRAPRWMPGGRAEIVYASAGIGRSKSGRAVGRSPFALYRLRFSDNSVEVLMADAQYDYTAAVPVSPNMLYAVRRGYEATAQVSSVAGLFRTFFGRFSSRRRREPTMQEHELVCITPKGSRLVAPDVLAFDVAANGDIVYSNSVGIFRMAASGTPPEPILALEHVEQLVVYW